MSKTLKKEDSFTLIELVIVIGILAILAAVIVIVLNPAQFLKESRDSRRITELQELNKALGLYQADGGSDLGTASTVYVSIPDTSATCANLGLPDLPDGWSYACVTESNLQNSDGTGWVPVDFSSVSFGNALSILPIDPVNTTSTGNYYTYVMGGSWELNAIFESSKYRNDTSIVKANLPGVFATGSNLTLSPITSNTGLVGYWKFDEDEGTTATDSSGSGNAGTLVNGPTWTTGQVDGALEFDGSDDYVTMGTAMQGTGPLSMAAWIKLDSIVSTYSSIIGRKWDWQLDIRDSVFKVYFRRWADYESTASNTVFSLGQWYHVAFTLSNDASNNLKIYINGNLDITATKTTPLNSGTESTKISGYIQTDINYFDGLIDDVRVYNRALSAAEIQAIYNATQ